jgi:hypothetical protein
MSLVVALAVLAGIALLLGKTQDGTEPRATVLNRALVAEPESLDPHKIRTKAGDEKNPYVIWATLYRGYTFDAMRRREFALAQYRKVLALPRRFASHDHAKARLDKPFQASDPELKKLEL